MRLQRTLGLAGAILFLMGIAFLSGLGLRFVYSEVVPQTASGLGDGRRFASTRPGDPDLRPSMLFDEALKKLAIYYVGPLPSDRTGMAYGAIEGMLALLNDPKTRLLSPREWEAAHEAAAGRFRGLGAWLTVRKVQPPERLTDRGIYVVSVLPGSAAEKAGLRSGDRIATLDGKWIIDRHYSAREMLMLTDGLSGFSPPREGRPNDEQIERARREAEELRRKLLNHIELGQAMVTLMAEEGEHELTVTRAGSAAPLTVRATFAPVEVRPIEQRKLNGHTGYLRLTVLNAAAAKAVEEALAAFAREGVRHLVIDLRQSPGGSLDVAVRIASAMIPSGVVVAVKERDANRNEVIRPRRVRENTVKLRPTSAVVLVDGGTAGASEALAAALRDQLGARLLGTRTFGDGTAEEIVELENGAAVSITRGTLLTPKASAAFDGRGLTPDGPAPDGAAAIQAALRALQSPARATPRRSS